MLLTIVRGEVEMDKEESMRIIDLIHNTFCEDVYTSDAPAKYIASLIVSTLEYNCDEYSRMMAEVEEKIGFSDWGACSIAVSTAWRQAIENWLLRDDIPETSIEDSAMELIGCGAPCFGEVEDA